MDETAKEAEWRQWVQTHARRFLLFARQQTRCESDAQDLVQEAVLEACHRGSGKPPDPPLVFATIHRRAIDMARRAERRAGREADAAAPEQAWFDPGLENRELQQLIEGAMRQLPENYSQVISLKIWGGLTFSEIGRVLDISANTAASRYRYGLAELRKLAKGVLA